MILWFLNAKQLKILNELRDELVIETLTSLGILVEWDGMPVADMFVEKYKKGHLLLQKHVMKVYKKRFRHLRREARKISRLKPKTSDIPPQEEKEPPKVITPDLIQIDDREPLQALPDISPP